MSITSGVGMVVNPSSMQSLRLNSQIAPVYETISSITGSNSASSAQQAALLRNWQSEQAKIAREFNASEAAKNRDWQKMMSDTAHQREVRDMIAAGINPVLSVSGGNGAAVTSGATASGVTSPGSKGETDMSLNSALVSLLNNVLTQKNQLDIANVTAQTNLAVADKYNAMSKYLGELQNRLGYSNIDLSKSLGELQALTSQNVAGIYASATKYAADASKEASRYAVDVQSQTSRVVAQINKASNLVSAQVHAAATRYAADVNSAASRYASDNSAANARYLQEAEQRFEGYVKKHYPSSVWGTVGSMGSILADFLTGTREFDSPGFN